MNPHAAVHEHESGSEFAEQASRSSDQLMISAPSTAGASPDAEEREDETKTSNVPSEQPGQQHSSRLEVSNWTGWAELENDPRIFATLLREWGVQHVGVREVIPLDSIFDTPASSTYGLIFLSRYVSPEAETEPCTPPSELWFANQVSSFSCATVALMNIVNNRPDMDIGAELEDFKTLTGGTMSAKNRGKHLDKFEHARNVHNSFSTYIDRLDVDMRLKEEVKTAKAKERAERAKAKAKAKSRQSHGRKRKKRHQDDDDDEENGLHFIAYVPACGQVWKMDGLERRPRSLGPIIATAKKNNITTTTPTTNSSNNNNSWLTPVIPDLQSQWESAITSELEFSLLSLVKEEDGDPDPNAERELESMNRVREDWGPAIARLLRLHTEKGDLASRIQESSLQLSSS